VTDFTNHTHTSILSHTLTALLGSDFQRRTFPFLCVPLLSPASATVILGVSRLHSKPKLTYDRRSVGQSASLSWCQATIWDSWPIFLSFSLEMILDRCGIVIMGRPLWWEVGCTIYSCCRDSPVKSFSGPSSAGLMTKCYCLKFETPPPWCARFLYLFPQEQDIPVMNPGVGSRVRSPRVYDGSVWLCWIETRRENRRPSSLGFCNMRTPSLYIALQTPPPYIVSPYSSFIGTWHGYRHGSRRNHCFP
jgi:hypothetical protein